MNGSINWIGEAIIFSMLEAKSGYWQIEIDDADKDKPAFTFHYGLYRFVRLPFGLCDAPDTFQHIMDVILFRVK